MEDYIKESTKKALDELITHRHFDAMIGRLDRVLSEMIAESNNIADDIDKQTLKHHAEDMIGAGQKILSNITKGE